MMKSLIKFSMLMLTVIILQSCDKVEPPYKKDVVITPPPAGVRKVLVEEFTGHKCGNCPRAAKALHDLKSIYGDNLVIIGVHAGFFATVFPPSAGYYFYDFRNPVSTALYNDFGVTSNPAGMVNRKTINGDIVLSSTKWADEINTVLTSTDPVPVKIEIANDYNNITRQLQTTVTTEFYSTLSGAHKLCVYMVEDSIINWQTDYDANPTDVPDYVHRDVLRGSMNGTYGDLVTETTQGTINTMNFTLPLDTAWNDQHFSVVAFLYNEVTKEIIQVEQEHVEP